MPIENASHFPAIISAASALIGAVIGAGATWFIQSRLLDKTLAHEDRRRFDLTRSETYATLLNVANKAVAAAAAGQHDLEAIKQYNQSLNIARIIGSENVQTSLADLNKSVGVVVFQKQTDQKYVDRFNSCAQQFVNATRDELQNS